MTENENPKPFTSVVRNFNVTSSGEQLYWVYQSINRPIYRQISRTEFSFFQRLSKM